MDVPDGAKRHTPDLDSLMRILDRIGDEALVDEWVSLYADDAVLDSIVDGAVAHYEGTGEIGTFVAETTETWRALAASFTTTVECADDESMVNTWVGGPGGAPQWRGVEIYRFREGKVVHHQMITVLNPLPGTSARARLRVALGAPRLTIQLARRLRELRRDTGGPRTYVRSGDG